MQNFAEKFGSYKFADIFLLSGTGLAYFVTAKFGLELASVHPSATAVWPPTGIAIAALLLFGYRMWPAVFMGAFLINSLTYGTALTSLGIALGNTLEGLVAAYLVNKFADSDRAFQSHYNVFKFFICAGLIATAVSATIGVTSLALGGFAEWSRYRAIWFTWWLGDFGGATVIAPFIISVFSFFKDKERSAFSYLRSFFAVALVLLFGLVVFNEVFIGLSLPVSSLVLPLLVWVASRGGRLETATTVLVLAGTSLWGTMHGLGPFGMRSPNEAFIFLQVYLGVMSLTTFALSAFQSEVAEGVGELKKFREAVDNANDHISITDKNGRILYMNRAAEQITGFSRTEAVGKKAGSKDLWGGLMDKKFYESLWRTVKEEKKPFISECTNRRKDGTLYPAEMTISPVLDENNDVKFFVEIERDITKEKELDQARMDFLSLASHQLRTPLSGTKWLIETLLRELPGPVTAGQKEYLTYIYQVNERMIHLVADMLDVLRIESGGAALKKADIQIGSFCRSVLLMTEASARKKKVAVRCDFADNSFIVKTDPEILKQILQSFLSNAIEYSPEGGEVVFSADTGENEISFSVRDSGIGIPPEERLRIFERFYRATNAKAVKPDGTGLGLYIAHMLAVKIGAKISFESEPGRGSTFHLHIPYSG